MKPTVCVMTGTRAEYGLLKPLIEKLDKDAAVSLRLLVTGTHLIKEYGNTQTEIAEDGFAYDTVPIPVGGASGTEIASHIGTATKAFAGFFYENKPDMLVILGDRYEAFAAATAAFTMRIPIAHISGGDVTEGAIDNGFRHAISMFATLHFPGCEASAQRLIRMGATPENVYSVGDPGVENCLNTDFMSISEIEESIDFSLDHGNYAVVTFHPATKEPGEAEKQVRELTTALDSFPDMRFIITLANADAEGDLINRHWSTEGKTHENWLVVPSLGVRRYLSVVKHSKGVIGNSSSGISEAPSLKVALGIPTVNIGSRQDGRPMAESVLCCAPERERIREVMKLAFSEDFREKAKKVKSLFGAGNTSAEICRIIKCFFEV